MRIPTFRSIAAFVLMALSGLCGVPLAIGAVLTVEPPVVTWDKVDSRLAGATPCAQMMYRSFKSWCMQNLRGINLQLLDVANLTGFTNPLDGAIRVYAIYIKKQNTATRAYFNLFDNATNDAVAADAKLSLPMFEAGKEAFLFFPDGLPLAAGLVLGAYTALIGANATTASTSGDGPNGFLLVG